MKATIRIRACALVLLVVCGTAPQASGDLIIGQSIGGSFFQTDIWALTCGPGSVTARAGVTDLGGGDGRIMNICVVNAHGAPGQCRSTDGGSSAEAIASGGPGHYLVTINEPGAVGLSPEPYSLFLTCRGANGAITPHSHFPLQNQ